jgi:hypothetical protein
MACKVMQVCSRDGEKAVGGYTAALFRETSRIVRSGFRARPLLSQPLSLWDRALPGMGLVSGDYSRWIA